MLKYAPLIVAVVLFAFAIADVTMAEAAPPPRKAVAAKGTNLEQLRDSLRREVHQLRIATQ